LVLHNSYQSRGGEDAVVAAETALLRQAGHSVHLEIVSNDSITGFTAKTAAFLNAPDDHRRKRWMDALLRRTGAELVHIHNFFPLLTPAVHEAAAERGVAVVQSLHNYRLLCAGALLLRDGQICEKCLGGSAAWGVVHRCYRNSLPGSLAIARMQHRARREATWHRHVHRFIVMTEFARQKFTAGGLPATKLAVKPNFTAPAPHEEIPRSGALFVGRLSPEKGVAVLLAAWRQLPRIALTIVGDGPERPRLEAEAPPNVTFIGALSPDAVRTRMLAAQCLVLPSLSYEGFPLTIVEAFAAGLPVLASGHGAMNEIITDGINGRTFSPGNPQALAEAVRSAFGNLAALPAMGQAARRTYDALYTPGANLLRLEAIYADALAEIGRNGDRPPS
jgi:glycosyltransferase involved in cell wall biosynthesis